MELEDVDRSQLAAFMQISPVEVTKLQAEYVIPLMKAFEAELGKERAQEIMKKALEPVRRREAELGITSLPGDTLSERMRVGMRIFSEGDALDVDYLQETENDLDFNVTGCKWAQHFKELGESELGYIMCCSGDRAIADHLPGVSLRRTQTIMEGAHHCDFRWHIEPGAKVPVDSADFAAGGD